MKLWSDGNGKNTPGAMIQMKVKDVVIDINRQTISRGVRAVNALRNAQLQVLKGQRSGRVYKKPYTYGAPSKASRKLKAEYGHKLKRGQLYRASAPDEPPARRTGNLRMHWNGQVRRECTSGTGISIVAELESQERYAGLLEHGTSKMKARPFVEKIKEKAQPEIQKIYHEPYT